jgi:UDP-glucose 4-epimerase
LKAIVTGGAGFIGSHLVESLLKLEAQVVVFDNLDDFYPGKEANLSGLRRHPKFKFVQADIRDFQTLSDATKGAKVVFHLAAQAGIRYCISNPIKAHEVNVTGTLNVMRAAQNAGVKKVVYASSSSVYGRPVKVPLGEDQPANPTSIYGATKLAGEKYCIALGETLALPVSCLRYFSVYGPRGRPDQVVSSFASKILKGERPIIYGDGSYTRDFTFVSDIVSATALTGMAEQADGKIINVGFGKEISIREVARRILAFYDSPLEIDFREGYAGDFPRTLCNNSLAKSTLSWRPIVDFEKGLKEELEWLKATVLVGPKELHR